ncbi:M1 family metallopeptidase [Nocardioides solisilvae]|uniref:M1 family metallopeptidase n=1 Tax=Nocardioides solisilvae TaxID=1542435 RepID=UPI000D74D59E|nr:M1 family metallopeptidase [Nocardioides solisilvae]
MTTLRRSGLAAGLVLGALVLPSLAPSQAAPSQTAPSETAPERRAVGSSGIGDPYFPLAGNGGYDVEHYDLALDYTPPAPEPAPLTGQLRGVARIKLVATQALRRFNLDLRGLEATSVTVDGRPARFSQTQGNELVVTPRRPLRRGAKSRVVVEYGGATGRPTDVEDALYGWVTTRDGAMVVSQPDGSATWFPVNDHPTDKATYRFAVTVPKGLTAVANGDLVGSRTRGGQTTWTWDAPDPMAAYLATATVGNFELRRSRTPSGVPLLDFLDEDLRPADRTRSEASLALAGEMATFLEALFGPYPFVSYGAIVDDDSVGYALETQTRSFFSRVASEGTALHELAHQWTGNHVGPRRWADIWLNEGWAEYATWMWTEARGGTTAQQAYEAVFARPADDEFWTTVVSDPGPTGLFADAIYDRGAATLHALRLAVGEEAFRAVARAWVTTYGGRTAGTRDFRRLAQRVSGRDLDALFDAWLDTPAKPAA